LVLKNIWSFLIDLSLQIEIRVEFRSITVVVVEDDEVDALGEQLSRCVFWVFLLIYSTKVFFHFETD
jgi:hypothetical protein